MLTFVEDKSAQELVGLYSNTSKSRKPEATLYFTHEIKPEKENVAPARGVLALHRDSLKKINKISQASFELICEMLDSGAEPEVGEPLRAEYWDLKQVYERSLRREMYLGDQSELRFEINLPRDKHTWGGHFHLRGQLGSRQDAVGRRFVPALPSSDKAPRAAHDNLVKSRIFYRQDPETSETPALQLQRDRHRHLGAGAAKERPRRGLLLPDQNQHNPRDPGREGPHRDGRLHGRCEGPRAIPAKRL